MLTVEHRTVVGNSMRSGNVQLLWCCLCLAFIFTSAHTALESERHEVDKMQVLKKLNVDFALRLYKSMASNAQSQNVFLSPLSVSIALSALSLGADGETHQQLLNGLGFNSSTLTTEEIHQAFLNLLQNFNQRTDVNLEVGTAVYIHDAFKPHSEFLEKIKRFYLSDGFSVNFNQTAETARQMNTYISEKTRGKINDFIKDLDPRTVMYLLSYVYFKGKWSIPFHPTKTTKDVFHVDEETTVPVKMMHNNDHFYSYYDRELSTHILRLDYEDSFSMILALADNLTLVEETLSQHQITRWKRWMQKREYNIYIPKMSIKTSCSMNNILDAMGMGDMFKPKANFTRMSDDRLFVSEAVHQATLDVDEAGATATAVTGFSFRPLSARTLETLKFNRPFIMLITDQKTNTVLFIGKILNPNSEL